MFYTTSTGASPSVGGGGGSEGEVGAATAVMHDFDTLWRLLTDADFRHCWS